MFDYYVVYLLTLTMPDGHVTQEVQTSGMQRDRPVSSIHDVAEMQQAIAANVVKMRAADPRTALDPRTQIGVCITNFIRFDNPVIVAGAGSYARQ